jgi:ATP phosphoribosyltransferase
MSDALIIAIPSKGRIMDETLALFARAGIALRKTVNERGYRGEMEGVEDVEVAYLSASEIALKLKQGRVHLGVTGEDLIRETIPDVEDHCAFLRPLGYGHADLVVAAPMSWVDVSRMSDIEDVAARFHRERRRHRRRAGVGRGRADRRHHFDRRDAEGQPPQDPR